MKDELTGFADRLKRLRKGAGLTQVQLAQQLGIKASTISAYETGAVIRLFLFWLKSPVFFIRRPIFFWVLKTIRLLISQMCRSTCKKQSLA